MVFFAVVVVLNTRGLIPYGFVSKYLTMRMLALYICWPSDLLMMPLKSSANSNLCSQDLSQTV